MKFLNIFCSIFSRVNFPHSRPSRLVKLYSYMYFPLVQFHHSLPNLALSGETLRFRERRTLEAFFVVSTRNMFFHVVLEKVQVMFFRLFVLPFIKFLRITALQTKFNLSKTVTQCFLEILLRKCLGLYQTQSETFFQILDIQPS